MQAAFLIVAVAAWVLGASVVRRRWRFADTPTSDAAHVFPGLTEVSGVVEKCGAVAHAATDGAECVWWTYAVERENRDKENRRRWVTVEQGSTSVPFRVRDASGTVVVLPDDEIDVRNTEARTVMHLSLDFLRPYARSFERKYEPGKLSRAFGAQFVSSEPINEFRGKWRANERRLLVGDQVFLTATARLNASGDGVELATHDYAGRRCTFELSRGDETAAVSSFASWWFVGFAGLFAVVFSWVGAQSYTHDARVSTLAPAVLLVAALVAWAIGNWNRVRRVRERCLFAWSLIDVACEQRSSLVPQLQSAVGAAIAHERGLLERVMAARSLGRQPDEGRAGTVRDADAAAVGVIASVEASPDLTTQANVAQLMQQLVHLNDRVAFGRRFYNDSVQRLADRIGTFPGSLFARLAGVGPLPPIDRQELPPLRP